MASIVIYFRVCIVRDVMNRNAVFERFRAAHRWFRLQHARTPEVWILLLHWNKMAAVSFFH